MPPPFLRPSRFDFTQQRLNIEYSRAAMKNSAGLLHLSTGMEGSTRYCLITRFAGANSRDRSRGGVDARTLFLGLNSGLNLGAALA